MQKILSPILDPIADDAMEYDEPIDIDRLLFRAPLENDENFLPIDGHTYGNLISGRGHVSDPDCGHPRTYYYSGKKATHSVWHCRQQGCPKCFRYWAAKLSLKAASFLWTHAGRRADHSGVAIYHCTLSPDLVDGFRGWKQLVDTLDQMMKPDKCKVRCSTGEWFDDQGRLCREYRMSLKYSRKGLHDEDHLGEVGYCYVKHPFRIHCRVCGIASNSHKLSDCPRCGMNDWGWYFSPHLHFITNFQFYNSARMRSFLKRKRCVFVNITSRSKNFFKTEKHLALTISYELGHARYQLRDSGQGKGQKALVWKAGWHPNHLKRHYEPEREYVTDDPEKDVRGVQKGHVFLPVMVRIDHADSFQFIYQVLKKKDGTPVYDEFSDLLYKTTYKCILGKKVVDPSFPVVPVYPDRYKPSHRLKFISPDPLNTMCDVDLADLMEKELKDLRQKYLNDEFTRAVNKYRQNLPVDHKVFVMKKCPNGNIKQL